MLKVVVCVSGGGTNLQAIIDAIKQEKITNTKIIGVISNQPNVKALDRAIENNIPNTCICVKDFETREEFNQKLLEQFKVWETDYIILAGFLVKISEIIVQEYENRIINVHPSLIPSFCGTGFYGLRVHEKVLEKGAKITGATVHFVDSGMDTGLIIEQKAVRVLEDDTPISLQKRVMEEAEWDILPQVIDDLANQRIIVKAGKVIRIGER